LGGCSGQSWKDRVAAHKALREQGGGNGAKASAPTLVGALQDIKRADKDSAILDPNRSKVSLAVKKKGLGF
jgi:hypothetical protein